MTERLWIMISALLLIVAAVFLWRNNFSAAFVTATLGAVAWFLSYRVQIRANIAATEHDSSDQGADDNSDEK